MSTSDRPSWPPIHTGGWSLCWPSKMSRSQYPPSPPLSHLLTLPSLPPLTSLPEPLKPLQCPGKKRKWWWWCLFCTLLERVLNLREGPTQAVDPVLLQSRLDEKWWANPTKCCCYLRHVQDLLWQMGNITNGDLENHLKAWLFRLVQWLNIIHFLRTTSQGSTNRVWKFSLECSSDMYWSREEFGKEI